MKKNPQPTKQEVAEIAAFGVAVEGRNLQAVLTCIICRGFDLHWDDDTQAAIIRACRKLC